MKLKDMSAEIRLMMVGMIVANAAVMMYMPFLPLYLEELGASVAQVGVFFTTMTLFGITFRILGGWISDNIGRVETIGLGGVMGFIATLGFTIAPTWQWSIAAALFLQTGISLVGPSFQAYTAEQAPEGATSSTFGLVSALFITCEIIGPLLGGFLISQYGFGTMMWAATATFGVAAAIRAWMGLRAEHNPKPLQIAALRRDVSSVMTLLLGGGLLMWLFLVDGFFDSSAQMAMPYLPKFVTEVGQLDESVYGGLFALSSFVAALAMWPGGIFADRYSERVSLACGGIMFALTWGVIFALPTVPGFILGFSLMGVAMSLFGPAFSSLLSKAVPKESLGITFGIFWTALGVMAIPAPYIGGMLYDRVAPEAPFVAAVALMVLVVPLALAKLGVSGQATTDDPDATATGEMSAVPVSHAINKYSTGGFPKVDLAAVGDGSDGTA